MFTPQVSAPLTRRQWLQGMAALSASAWFAGCSSEMRLSGSASPAVNPSSQILTNPQPVPGGPFTQASLNIATASVGSIGPAFAGLSYEKSSLSTPLFSGQNADLVSLFKLLGPGLLRIGGNSVDQTVWTPGGGGRTAGQIAPADVASLAEFLRLSGWQCIYGVNLGGAATGATTPELASAEVAYAAQQLGPALAGIEIGNECDGYGAAGSYFAGDWSLAQFESLWESFRAAILAVTPGVAVTGPASGSNVASWTVPFGEAMTSSRFSLLTQHYYRGDGNAATSTAANLVSPDANLPRCLGMLAAGAEAAGVPYRLGECNSYFDGGAMGVSDSYASALWVLDFLFGCAQGGAAGVNLHGGGDAPGYTPIADNDGAVVAARPEFHGLLLFTLAGQGTLLRTQLSAGQLNATAYAVQTPEGATNVVLVNKDATQNLDLSVLLPRSATTASLIGMTAPGLTATSGVKIQGAAVGADGSFAPAAAYTLAAGGSQLDCYVPALSAVLIQIE